MVDTEISTFEKGNPFARRNRLCYLGIYSNNLVSLYDVRLGITGSSAAISTDLNKSDGYIGFNLKFDLHWLRRSGLPLPRRIWDCQLAHFLLTNQKNMYPSLDGVCEHYGIPGKKQEVAALWEAGIDTPDIPKELMLTYLEQDLRATWQVYQRQQEDIEKRPELKNLMRMSMDDLLVLQDMEYNGLKFNTEKALEQEQQIRKRLVEIEGILKTRCPNTPINWDSVDHLSAYLYGGSIVIDRKELAGQFQSGEKKGQPRYRHVEDVYIIPRLVEPLENSKLKKEGLWSTGDDVLKQLKQVPEIKLLQERAKATKLLDYLSGFPALIVQKDWEEQTLHGQFNQVVARTGRLSSSNPNLQNLPDPVLRLIETRYR